VGICQQRRRIVWSTSSPPRQLLLVPRNATLYHCISGPLRDHFRLTRPGIVTFLFQRHPLPPTRALRPSRGIPAHAAARSKRRNHDCQRARWQSTSSVPVACGAFEESYATSQLPRPQRIVIIGITTGTPRFQSWGRACSPALRSWRASRSSFGLRSRGRWHEHRRHVSQTDRGLVSRPHARL
jgi:hypothetical protein